MKRKKAVLLINLGSPDSPAPKDVYRYLTEFLNDPRVIDIHPLGRFLLVNGIIVPFRHRKSARVYRKLWTENGSPLVHYGREVQQLLQERFNKDETRVFLAMRYQNPSMASVLSTIQDWEPDELVVLPMFPQYASASSGSVLEKFSEVIRKWWVIPNVRIISQFYDHPLYIRGFVERGRAFATEEYDHILFSFHGLPGRQVDKAHRDGRCRDHSCESEINEENKFCYKATCYATARMIAAGLGIEEDRYTVCFQSRLGKGWIEPFSDHVIESLGKKGAGRLLVFSPAFVADCLETTIEIGVEYQELFEHYGGKKIQLVPSLNDSKTWIDCLEDLVK